MSRRPYETDVLWLALLPVAVLGFGGIVLGAALWSRRERRRQRTLATNMDHLLHHLHNYAIANDENFPLKLDRLVDEGYIPWLPANPFTGGPVEEVLPGQRHVPGGFTYLPWRDKSSGEVVAATLVGYGRSPRLRGVALPPYPGLPLELPWPYCHYLETTGFLPESPDEIEPAN